MGGCVSFSQQAGSMGRGNTSSPTSCDSSMASMTRIEVYRSRKLGEEPKFGTVELLAQTCRCTWYTEVEPVR